jgi:biotin carboxyl carrier protein
MSPRAEGRPINDHGAGSPVSSAGPGGAPSRVAVRVDGTSFSVELEDHPDGSVEVRVDGQPVDVDARLPPAGPGSVLVDGVSYLVDVHDGPEGTEVLVDGEAFRVQIEDPGHRGRPASARPEDGGGQRLVAPMPGKVVAVLVTVGQRVEPGAGLIVLEAMKMENEFRATAGGVVAEIHAGPGQAVNAGDLLVVLA